MRWIEAHGICWDTEEDVTLPVGASVSEKSLLHIGEEVNELREEELFDRMIDHLTDTFGFCIEHVESMTCN